MSKKIAFFYTAEDMDNLHTLVRQFGADSAQNKYDAIRTFGNLKPKNAEALFGFHEALLFLKAYPDNPEILNLVNTVLESCEKNAAEIFVHPNRNTLRILEGSGLNGTTLTARFSYGLTQHIAELYPWQIALFMIDCDEIRLREMIQSALTLFDQESVPTDREAILAWMEKEGASIGKTGLQYLLNIIQCSSENVKTRNALYEFLQVFITIKFDNKIFSRAILKVSTNTVYFQSEPLVKKVSLDETLLRPEFKVFKIDTETLIETAKLSLLSLGKETDPITFGNPDESFLYDAGKGLTFALFHMNTAYRLPHDTYVGYMAFRNGIPFSYGGAWCFGRTAQIGINIYETFRGGESATMLCNLIKLYHQEYGADYFRVEPYQLGYDNEDGLKSGVFWFYYRLGFRPENAKLKTLAADEWKKIQQNKTYRTPIAVLRKLVNGYMGYFVNDTFDFFDPGLIGPWLDKSIERKYMGNKKLAYKSAVAKMKNLLHIAESEFKKWSVPEVSSFHYYSLLFDFIPEVENSKNTEQKELMNLMKSKGGAKEKEFVRLWQKNRFSKLLENACMEIK